MPHRPLTTRRSATCCAALHRETDHCLPEAVPRSAGPDRQSPNTLSSWSCPSHVRGKPGHVTVLSQSLQWVIPLLGQIGV